MATLFVCALPFSNQTSLPDKNQDPRTILYSANYLPNTLCCATIITLRQTLFPANERLTNHPFLFN